MSPADRPVRPEGDDTPRQDVYVYAGPGLVERSREVGDGVVVDYGPDGSVVGVEVLDVQRVTINNRTASAAPETIPDAAIRAEIRRVRDEYVAEQVDRQLAHTEGEMSRAQVDDCAIAAKIQWDQDHPALANLWRARAATTYRDNGAMSHG